MIDIRTLDGGAVAAIDVLTGAGLLALRPVHEHVADPFAIDSRGTLDVELGAACEHLDRLGVDLADGDSGGLSWEADLSDGRRVLGLYVREPIAEDPELLDVEPWAECRAALEATASA